MWIRGSPSVKETGHDCVVVAPSMIPKKPGERVKTARSAGTSSANPSELRGARSRALKRTQTSRAIAPPRATRPFEPAPATSGSRLHRASGLDKISYPPVARAGLRVPALGLCDRRRFPVEGILHNSTRVGLRQPLDASRC